jgi:DNA-directed RNA polymerase specialized sigma24 family protein
MTALDTATAYAILPENVRRHAIQQQCWHLGGCAERADVEQMAWEAVGLLAQRYQPRDGVPAEHYLAASFRFQLGRLAARTRARGKDAAGEPVEVRRSPHAHWYREQVPDPASADLAESAAWTDLLAAIPVAEARVLWLHAVEGWTFKAIAGRCGERTATVFDRYKRAVALARAYWEENAA